MCRSQSVSENFRPLDFWNEAVFEQRRQFLVLIDHKGRTNLMTNFEISAARESPLKESQARMSFHFLSPTKKTSFEWYTGFVGIMDCVAWVSSMRDCSNSVEQGSLSSLACHYPRISIWRCRGWNLTFNSMSAKKLYNMNLKNWSNYGSFWNCGMNSGSVCILSECWSSISKNATL